MRGRFVRTANVTTGKPSGTKGDASRTPCISHIVSSPDGVPAPGVQALCAEQGDWSGLGVRRPCAPSASILPLAPPTPQPLSSAPAPPGPGPPAVPLLSARPAPAAPAEPPPLPAAPASRRGGHARPPARGGSADGPLRHRAVLAGEGRALRRGSARGTDRRPRDTRTRPWEAGRAPAGVRHRTCSSPALPGTCRPLRCGTRDAACELSRGDTGDRDAASCRFREAWHPWTHFLNARRASQS
ncbi:protein enabled homolog [Panthera tigris]|uniref:protein enabled homolog n=1 Tax=Panthera tigris TaxID=9694 RepID=UPI001C6F7D39|nr:protein enabled homolog [Panthera tigris]